jgi:LPS-assembly protein
VAKGRRWATGRRLLAVLAAFLGLGLLGSLAWAAGELIRVDAKGPVDIRADQITYDEAAKSYLAEGEVEIVRGDNRIFADKARLHSQTLVAEAEGRVRLNTPTETLTGQRMLVDLQGGTGKVYDGQIFIKPNNFYLRGQEIEKTGKDSYHMDRGSFTTCDGANPAWTVSGRDMNVDIEGYGTLRDPAFRIKDWPVLWSPWAAFPAKFKRQSGLLPPQVGMPDRDGIPYSQPYFQTLGEDQDATLTLNYMSYRGLDYGLEYRYHLDRGSKGIFMIDYLPEDGMGQELKDSFKNVEAYNSRYWFRMKGDQQLFNGTMLLKADVDLVSDQDYLREFAYGYTGYEASNSRFIEWMGRELDTRHSTWRTNQINLQRYWSNATFNGSVTYYDDLTTDNKTTQQQLPKLTFDATRQAVGDTGWYFQMGSSYTYYYQQEGAKGHISDISPTFSLPLNFNDYIAVEPSFAWKQRFFSVDRDSATDTGDTTGTTELWNFQTQASTYMYRVFEMGTPEDPLKIKHAFKPNVTYSYQPNIDYEDLALLARQNQTQTRVNKLSYGVNNTLTSKRIKRDDETGEVRPIYRDFLQFNIAHAFDMDQFRSDDHDPHYWGNVDTKVEVYPSKYLYLSADSSFNLYENRWDSVNSLLKTMNRRGDSITVDYRFTHDLLKQVRGKFTVALTKEWSVSYINHRDLNGNSDFESIYEVAYQGQCWGIRAFYVDDIEERGYFLAFSLGGFGELFGWGQIRSTGTTSN